tara:strand:- start:2749 stop:3927 length:1179 start_codon:yes stop_codon:yes gene_type:complete
MSLDKYTNQTINKQDNKKRINKNKNNMTVKRKSPETTNPNKKHKRISRDEKIEIAISKFEEYEKSVKDTLKMLRDIKRESLRPPAITIPEITATFSSSDDSLSVTPNYSGVSPQCENFITAPRQLIDAPDGSVTSKRVFPNGEEVYEYSSDFPDDNIQIGDRLDVLDLYGTDPSFDNEIIDLLSDTEEEDFGYSGLEGKMKAFYDWRVVPLQALVRGWLLRKNKEQAHSPCLPNFVGSPRISYDGKMRAYYGCQAIKMQAVVRGGLVRMRIWREKCEKNSKILLRGTIKIQALVRGWLARKRLKKHNRIIKLVINNTAIKIQALARRFLVRMRVWNVRSTNPEFASAVKSVVRGWLLGEPKKCVKHDFIPVRSGYDHTTYECRNCDYESGCV